MRFVLNLLNVFHIFILCPYNEASMSLMNVANFASFNGSEKNPFAIG
jgi:hypothetical protein